jgi:hypothetical protein
MRFWITIALLLGGYKVALLEDQQIGRDATPAVEEGEVSALDGGSSFPPPRP